jgi:hypothetical protein
MIATPWEMPSKPLINQIGGARFRRRCFPRADLLREIGRNDANAKWYLKGDELLVKRIFVANSWP